MSDQDNIKLVQEAYAAFGRGDVPGLLAHLDPAVEWECPGPAEISWAGSRRGHAQVQAFFAALGGQAEFSAFEPRAFFAGSDTVVVLGFERATIRATGRAYETHWTHAFTIVGGKITRFREYSDSAAIATACRKS